MHRVSFALSAVLVLALVFLDFGTLRAQSPVPTAPAHHLVHGFRNVDPGYRYPQVQRMFHLLRAWPDRGPLLPVVANDGAELRANGTVPTVTWVGHSTFLVQLDGINILTDPIWGDHTGPLRFAGPKRLIPPGIPFEDLPQIHAVVISHDHYDHLDVATVTRLDREHHPTFFVPLGLKAWFAGIGIHEVVEMDWWDRARLGPLTFVCTPAQHSSGRTFNDQNLRLWSSWAILGRTERFFFAGDTGYYPGLAEIGERLGPFDLAAIPIGGYSSLPAHHPNHVNPEEAIQLFLDVRARRMVPMHWGTFAMNHEPFNEPPTRLRAEARRRGIEDEVSILKPGETLHW